jgi:hypothetical protein
VRDVHLDRTPQDSLPVGERLSGPAEEEVDGQGLEAGLAGLSECTKGILGGMRGLDGVKVVWEERTHVQAQAVEAQAAESMKITRRGICRVDFCGGLFKGRRVEHVDDSPEKRMDGIDRKEGGATAPDVGGGDGFFLGVRSCVAEEFTLKSRFELRYVGVLNGDRIVIVVNMRILAERDLSV